MSALTMAANMLTDPPGECFDEEASYDCTPSNESPISRTYNQENGTKGSEELCKHLEKLIQEKENEEDPEEGKISFGSRHSFF